MSELNDHGLAERQRNRELRASILRAAKITLGTKTTVTVENCWRIAGKTNYRRFEVVEQINYLVMKSYLVEHAVKRDARDDAPPTTYAITARGFDVLNGDIADEAIEI